MPNENDSLTEKRKAVRVTTFLSLFLNLVLIIAKFIGGIFFGSLTLITDGVHSLSDVFTDIIIFFALKFSMKAPDEGHPYGHGKMENLVAAIVGVILIGVSATFIFESITNLISGEISVPKGRLPFIIAAFSILVKELLFRITKRWGERVKSPALIANAWHHRSDALSSVIAVAALGSGALGFVYGDILGSVLIAVVLIRVGVKVIMENSATLLEASVEESLHCEMMAVILETEGVKHAHRLRLRYVGDKIFGEVNLEISGEITVREGHDIALSVKRRLFHKFDQLRDISVHIDPLDE